MHAHAQRHVIIMSRLVLSKSVLLPYSPDSFLPPDEVCTYGLSDTIPASPLIAGINTFLWCSATGTPSLHRPTKWNLYLASPFSSTCSGEEDVEGRCSLRLGNWPWLEHRLRAWTTTVAQHVRWLGSLYSRGLRSGSHPFPELDTPSTICFLGTKSNTWSPNSGHFKWKSKSRIILGFETSHNKVWDPQNSKDFP